MAWVTGLVAAYSAYSASQQDSGGGASEALANQQAAIGAEDRATYKRLYAPREEQFLNSVFDSAKSPAAEAARAGAEASAAADNAEQITLRNARRSGININSPAMASLTRRTQADRAGSLASAKTYGRRYADDVNFTRQSSALGMGRNLTSNAISANASAFDMYSTLDSAKASRDAAKGDLYGQAAGYIGSGLQDYLKGRKKENPYLAENNPDSLDY